MTTNPPIDLSRINLMEPDEVQYWADKFGVSKERLSEAVGEGGPLSRRGTPGATGLVKPAASQNIVIQSGASEP